MLKTNGDQSVQLAAKRKEAAKDRAEREKERAERGRQEEREKRKARLDAGFAEVGLRQRRKLPISDDGFLIVTPLRISNFQIMRTDAQQLSSV